MTNVARAMEAGDKKANDDIHFMFVVLLEKEGKEDAQLAMASTARL